MADGLIGGSLPVMVLYFPVVPDSPYVPRTNTSNTSISRYWTMVATQQRICAAAATGVAFRFQQIGCQSAHAGHPRRRRRARPARALIGAEQYWDTFWWTRSPDGATNSPASQTPPAPRSFTRPCSTRRRIEGYMDE